MSARPLTPTQVAIAKPIIRVSADMRPMRAHTADDAERADYWPKLVAMNRD